MTTIRFQSLMTLSIQPVIRWIKKQLLEAKLRRLYMQEQYFRDQVRNGNAGWSYTHKQIVLVESDLRDLK